MNNPTQYRYSTRFVEGRWHVLAEDDLGNTPLLLAKRATEAAALATTNYMQNIRTMKITSPHLQDDWF